MKKYQIFIYNNLVINNVYFGNLALMIEIQPFPYFNANSVKSLPTQFCQV